MKKKVFWIVIGLLGILAAYLVLMRGQGSVNLNSQTFSLPSAEEIDEVRIESEGESVVLLRKDDKWWIGDREADKQRVKNLLMLSELLEVTGPVSDALIDSVRDCIRDGKKLSFLENGRVRQEILICNLNRQLFATKLERQKIFKISPRGFSNVNFTALLRSDEGYWKGNLLIDLPPEDIRLIHIQYSDPDKQGFALYAGDEKLALKSGKEEYSRSEIDIREVEDYLHFFRGIEFEMPGNQEQVIGEISGSEPFFSLQLLTADSKEISLAGFRIKSDDRSTYDPYKFCAVTRTGECIFLRFEQFDPVLAELQDFLKK